MLNKIMGHYQSSMTLVLILLLLGAALTVLLAASAQRSSDMGATGVIFGQEGITLKVPSSPPISLTVSVVDVAVQGEYARPLRGQLPEDGGLLWLYPRVTDQPLEARDYPSPVSVALFDRGGLILQILDIDPCDIRCPSHFPRVAYRGRLEVARGWFDHQGVGVGSQIEARSIQIMWPRPN